MKEKIKKIKVSKKQFADALYFWLSKRMDDKNIEKIAKNLEFIIRNGEDFKRISNELFFLNMWTMVRACEDIMEDVNKRNECLDILHQFVYEHRGKNINSNDWNKTIAAKYSQYEEAMKTERPAGPLWVLAKLINKNIFGKTMLDIDKQMMITIEIVADMKYSKEFIEQFDIK